MPGEVSGRCFAEVLVEALIGHHHFTWVRAQWRMARKVQGEGLRICCAGLGLDGG